MHTPLLPLVTALCLALIGTAAHPPSVSAAESRACRVYVSLGGGGEIALFELNNSTGELTSSGKFEAGPSPGSLALAPGGKTLYAAIRGTKSVAAFGLDPKSGGLSRLGSTPVVDNPVYITVDPLGKHLLMSSYNGDKAAVYSLGTDGTLNPNATSSISTGKNPHSIITDPSGKHVFIPNTGADKILQFDYDAAKGALSPNSVPEVPVGASTGPRHIIVHPGKKLVYTVNEKGGSVTGLRLDATTGRLTPFQTISTLPAGYSGMNACADIHTTPDGRFLYASNRGHNSIAGFSVDAGSGQLSALGQTPTEKVPRAFAVDPGGHFLLAAGQESNQLAVYRIDTRTGALAPLKVYPAGPGPAWVLCVPKPQ